MTKQEVKINNRYYHAIFGWCTVTHPVLTNGKVLVDLEADEIKYYSIGEGYVSYRRDKKGGRNILFTSIEDLLKSDKEKLPRILALKRVAMNPELIFWNKNNT